LLIRHSKYSAILPKIHSYRLLFRRFCPPRTNLFRNIWLFFYFCSYCLIYCNKNGSATSPGIKFSTSVELESDSFCLCLCVHIKLAQKLAEIWYTCSLSENIWGFFIFWKFSFLGRGAPFSGPNWPEKPMEQPREPKNSWIWLYVMSMWHVKPDVAKDWS